MEPERLSDFCTIMSSINDACHELIRLVESFQFQRGFLMANNFKLLSPEIFLQLPDNSKYSFGIFKDPLDLLQQFAIYIDKGVIGQVFVIIFQDLQITKVGKFIYSFY
jgi:hypothetical protein